MNCLASHCATDHIIELKPDIKFSYMQTYNMSLAELKTLDIYINNALIKDWICEFQNSADVFILFVFKKSGELHLCVDYQELNAITVKNHYSLSLASELLDWLGSFYVFSKIDLWNIYHRIWIHKEDK